jgi:hypothetical protein
MRFMMVTKERVNEPMPNPNSVVVMFKYMESLDKAGVLLAFDGLQPIFHSG